MIARTTPALMMLIVACLLSVLSLPTLGDVSIDVTKGSQYDGYFKVEVRKAGDSLKVTVKVPKKIDGNEFELMAVTYDSEVVIYTNGTELEFLIDADKYEQLTVHAGYLDPDHDPEESGGLYSYALNISSLWGDLE